ncbi:MAG: glycoside hydrolase family 127 protein [Pontiellaceae bacterium]|nr:glycoside hydrolase family 127 protein [Pontiellaceae bacterium]
MASILCSTPQSGLAEGDQFLDGIGETALIARYVFDGNLVDSSRNALHASMENGADNYTEDEQFGRVLDLSGTVHLPSQALNHVENLSIVGWIKLTNVADKQTVFAMEDLLSWEIEPKNQRISIGGKNPVHVEDPSFRASADQWIHLALVLDRSKKTLSFYVDGARKKSSAVASIPNLLDGESKPCVIGRAFRGQLHDFRLYRTALTERQVAVIHHNAISDEKWDAEPTEQASGTAQAASLYSGLTGVESVTVKTRPGELPELPYTVAGIYADRTKGPAVRVLWPAPRDLSQLHESGTYTVEGHVPGTQIKAKATVRIVDEPAPTPPERILSSFPLGQVTLTPDAAGNPTPFMEHRDKFLEGLAASNPDTFLYNFRDAFGQPQPEGTRPLYGWDSQTTRLRGHASGHYLTAIAQAYASTAYDPELQALFESKMNYMVDVLYDLAQRSGKPIQNGGPHNADPCTVPPGPGKADYDSDLSVKGIRTDYWNWGEGFISGYPPDQFIMLEHGASYGTGNNQIWAPYYTLHKILAGLMDCYEVGGNPKALETAKGMGLWVSTRLSTLPQETLTKMWSSYIAGEYGGMNEAMARLHRLTGDERFLDCARLFDNTTFFSGLAHNIDTLRGKHANQHIPQITGALRMFEETKEPSYYQVAENFWDICLNSYMYSIGGTAGAKNPNNAECFTAEPDTLFRNGLSDGGQNETCATYNLLKLGRGLFMHEADAAYMDYYERALYNHILASVAEHDAGNTYHVPLNPGAAKSFGNARMNSFTCCNGTALESATKLQNTIYLKSDDDQALYVNLYIPSTLNWAERNVQLTQTTRYPYADTIKLTVNGAGSFSLNLRIPDWVKSGFELKINGHAAKAEAVPGRYLRLHRQWNDGDTVELRLPMDFHLMPLMDQPDVASLFYGPVLLAAEESGARDTWRTLPLDPENIGETIKGDPSTLRFNAGDVRFKPFFETYSHHSVYLKIVPTETTENQTDELLTH